MISQWMINNLEKVAVVVILVPMASSLAMSFFFIVDGWFKDYKWYGRVMYGSVERDSEYADEFFGKAFLSLGIVSILTPFIVILSYLYITGKEMSDLWLDK